jgi:tetraacyldisaccharide 4'-kinase
MDEHLSRYISGSTPASWLYGAAVMMRNKLFDWEVLQSKSFDIYLSSA